MSFRPRPPALALLTAALLAGCATSAPGAGTVELQLLAINDFHGNLEAPANGANVPDPADPTRTVRTPAGGVARLATLAAQRRAAGPKHTVMVAAGDLIGASPLLSSLFNDEPSLEALGKIGLAISAVGNHEFDQGIAELKRLQVGGCHPTKGCQGPAPYKGASFQYLGANVLETGPNRRPLPAYVVRRIDGIKVGFIGVVLEGVPQVASAAAVAGLSFADEADTVNALVPELSRQGVKAIVLLIHEGGYPGRGAGACPELSGPITDIVARLDPAVDLVVSGHTHSAYICRLGGRLVTSAGQYGTQLTDIRIILDRTTGDVAAVEASNHIVRPELPEDPAIAAHVASYRRLAGPLIERPVGRVEATISKSQNPAGESAMGKVVADAFLAAARKATGQQVDLSFMNPGGVRADVELKAGGQVVYGDIFAVQPFNDEVVVLSMSGRDILAVLDQQLERPSPYVLQVSKGFAYAWRRRADGKGEVVPGSVMLNGRPVDPAATYHVAVSTFLAGGGDSFPAFREGSRTSVAGTSVEALEAWFRAHAPVTADPDARITLTSR